MSPTTYLRWNLATLLLGSLLCVTLVVLVDPYGLYGLIDRPGFNQVKPALTRYQDEIKVTRALHSGATQLIFGNSRADIGFDPATPAMAARGAGYNLAIPGTGIGVAVQQLRYLRAHGVRPATVVAGMEFLDFMDRQSVPPPVAAHPVQDWSWRVQTLFSLSSVKDALTTLAIQHDEEAATISAGGYNPLRDYVKYARADGYYQMFAQRARENAVSFTRKAMDGLNEAEVRREVGAFLDAAAAPGADIHLLIYPYHAQILLLMEETGIWPAFERWKTLLIAAAEQARRRHPDARITLHDFSGYGVYACETIPAPDDRRSVTQWYWEGGHFKKALGDIVLRQTLQPQPGLRFGYVLDHANGEQNRRRIAAERDACQQRQPRLFSETRRFLPATGPAPTPLAGTQSGG
ncbi:hypothetical protein [Duganella callida]|uniref:Uncharacterized protein n=1 Tax=Duganella callida TaxID=2561932 RepID=A0A4Y9S9S5_9BURK|nr:hypothetical protein [Duganella callida]TFW17281.1 hypothetical protein E4L98_21160 [Duganella callida]